MNSTIKAVFFDAGGTLFRPYPSVGEIYARAASRYGGVYKAEELEQEFHAVWKKRGGLSSLGTETNEEKEHAWWYTLVSEVFEPYGKVERFDDFFRELHRSFEEKHLWEVYPDVGANGHSPLLTELRNKGLILGIVSNWDLRLPKVVRNLGLDSYFDFLMTSSMCGATKPSNKIFREALNKAGTRPEEVIHVGDTYEEDFVGAKGVGIKPFLLDRAGKGNTVPEEFRISSLRELLDKINMS
ncbi:MAG: HAD-IA family hydrolase [Candidatus Omnitrophica bacterium]|nr:HAD-IA family hydrolase [Candidatus Omnitrophota bacterium]